MNHSLFVQHMATLVHYIDFTFTYDLVFSIQLNGQINNTCNINKLVHRRHTQLLNFAYNESQDHTYLKEGNRDLRRYDAPILYEHKSDNKYFERSLLFQCALN